MATPQVQTAPSSENATHAQMKGANQNLGALVKVFAAAFPLHSHRGSFTMAAASSKAVSDPAIKSGSIVWIMPTNAAAAALLAGAQNLYFTMTPDVGFTVSTAAGGNGAGTETFEYLAVSIG